MARTKVMMLGTLPVGAQSLPSEMFNSGMQPGPDWRTSFITSATTVGQEPQNLMRNVYKGPPFTQSSIGMSVIPSDLRGLGKLGALDSSISWFDEQRARYNAMTAASDPTFVALSERTIAVLTGSMRLMGAAVGGYHGYKRNKNSVGWAAAWAAAGLLTPVITVGLVQGLAQRK